MRVFVDTSAFLAVLDRSDIQHRRAREAWAQVLQPGEAPLTSNYVVVETTALLQARFGIGALRVFNNDVLPVLEIAWIDEGLHHAAMGAVLASGRRGPSLVDCTSFEVMRRRGVRTAFAFDQHFGGQGFSILPE